MTTAEIKAILDAWIPKYIRQIVELRAGNKLTAERFNELMNLLIEQGDDTIALISKVREYIDAFSVEESAARQELIAFVNTSVSSMSTSVTNALQAVAALDTKVDEYQTTVLARVDTSLAGMQTQVDSVENKLNTAGVMVEDAGELYAAFDDMTNKINGVLQYGNYLTETDLNAIFDGTYVEPPAPSVVNTNGEIFPIEDSTLNNIIV